MHRLLTCHYITPTLLLYLPRATRSAFGTWDFPSTRHPTAARCQLSPLEKAPGRRAHPLPLNQNPTVITGGHPLGKAKGHLKFRVPPRASGNLYLSHITA